MNVEQAGSEVQINNKKTEKTQKNIFIFVLFFVFLISIIFISKSFMDKKFVSEDEIQQIVFSYTKSFPEEVSDYKCEIDFYENQTVVYHVSYLDSNGVYKFIIDCKTGAIIDYIDLKTSNISE